MEDQKWELLLTDRVSTEQFELLHELSRSQPERIASWMTAYMERVQEGSVLLDAAYSLLPAGDWPLVIEAAIGCLRASREHEAAASAIAYASLQCPQLLSPYIREMFRLRPNANAYYSHWYCRGAGEEHVEEWTELEYTVWALLETRQEYAIEAAVDCRKRRGSEGGGRKLGECLPDWGWSRRGERLLDGIGPPSAFRRAQRSGLSDMRRAHSSLVHAGSDSGGPSGYRDAALDIERLSDLPRLGRGGAVLPA